jgi:hypothetical protein
MSMVLVGDDGIGDDDDDSGVVVFFVDCDRSQVPSG